MKISNGKIRLENKVLDLSALEIRSKTKEQDLENHYDSFICEVPTIEEYFHDVSSFKKAVQDASQIKRPKLVARETKYPFLYGARSQFSPFSFLRPKSRRLNEDYFTVAQCITSIVTNNPVNSNSSKEKPLDELLRTDISKKFEKYPGYEGILEIPNDRNSGETKALTFHEALHYIIIRYMAETGRRFATTFGREGLTQLEKYQVEYLAHERAVEILTDKLLVKYPDAQFENRWTEYALRGNFINFAGLSSALATGFIGGTLLVNNPALSPLAILPGRIKDYVLHKYKSSKKQEILKPREYPHFKI